MLNRLLSILIIILVFIWLFVYWTFFYIPKKAEEKRLLEEEQILQIQEKKPFLEKISILEKISEETSEQKIDRLKKEANNYKTIYIWNNIFSFKENTFKLNLFLWEKMILSDIDYLEQNLLKISEIKWDNNDFFITLWNKKYIYNNDINKIYNIKLNLEVDYVKYQNFDYIIKTKEGSFVFDTKKDEINYFDFFEDFVYFDNWYIWVIRKTDSRRKTNLSLDFSENIVLVKYNLETKEKEVIIKSDIDLDQIYILNDNIYLLWNNNEIYELKNTK